MPSDQRRLRETWAHIERVRRARYPHICEEAGRCSIRDLPFADLPDRKKLAILTAAVRWDGISGLDQATILLSNINDPENLTTAQRDRLLRMAAAPEQEARRRGPEMEML